MKKILIPSLLSVTLFAVQAKSFVTRSPKTIAIVGATSEIGRSLTRALLSSGHKVIATSDNEDELLELKLQEGEKLTTKYIPITVTEKSRAAFKDLIKEAGSLDICILCSCIAPEIKQYGLLDGGDIPWKPSKDTIQVNVMGMTALANIAMNHFIDRQEGYLVGISSLDSLVGHPGCPCYTASKAFMSNYLGAMRKKCQRLKLNNITICDIRWSFVDQLEEDLGIGWTENPDQAALAMLKAIEQKKSVAYIMDRWSFAVWSLMAVPSLVQNLISGMSVVKNVLK